MDKELLKVHKDLKMSLHERERAKILLPHLSHLYFRESVLKTTSTVLCGILVAGICSLAFCGNQTQTSPSITVLTHEPYCLASAGVI